MSGRWQTGVIVHGVGRPGRDLEPGEARYWISEAQFDLLVDLIAARPAPEQVRISFDDGNLSDYDIALPRLAARGLRAEFFVLTGRIGQAGSLDAGHIRALQGAGMTIGSHGINHINWAGADAQTLRQEVSISRARLSEICGTPITRAAIPFGSYNGRVLRALRAAGYDRAYSSDKGQMRAGRFLCPRGSVDGGMERTDLAKLIAGQLPPLGRVRRALGMVGKRF